MRSATTGACRASLRRQLVSRRSPGYPEPCRPQMGRHLTCSCCPVPTLGEFRLGESVSGNIDGRPARTLALKRSISISTRWRRYATRFCSPPLNRRCPPCWSPPLARAQGTEGPTLSIEISNDQQSFRHPRSSRIGTSRHLCFALDKRVGQHPQWASSPRDWPLGGRQVDLLRIIRMAGAGRHRSGSYD